MALEMLLSIGTSEIFSYGGDYRTGLVGERAQIKAIVDGDIATLTRLTDNGDILYEIDVAAALTFGRVDILWYLYCKKVKVHARSKIIANVKVHDDARYAWANLKEAWMAGDYELTPACDHIKG